MDVSGEVLGIAKHFLRKVGRSGNENIMAVCPFHRKADGSSESVPSFSMSLTKGVYFCHGCHEKGTLGKFLQAMGLDRNTIELHYGMVLEEVGKNLPPLERAIQPDSIFQAPPMEDSILGLFDHDVTGLLPQFSPETLRHFQVGWDGWWHRITFPIWDIRAQLVAVSGRAVHEEQEPRYKIYEDEYKVWDAPARKGWKKNSVLWHMHELYPELLLANGDPEQQYIIVVEGFKAAMWVWQCGYKNVVAMLGSYLSTQQQWILESIGCRVYLFLDNNNAGREGQLAAARRLNKRVPVSIVTYPPRLVERYSAQPDDLEQQELIERVTQAPLYHHWRFGAALA